MPGEDINHCECQIRAVAFLEFGLKKKWGFGIKDETKVWIPETGELLLGKGKTVFGKENHTYIGVVLILWHAKYRWKETLGQVMLDCPGLSGSSIHQSVQCGEEL